MKKQATKRVPADHISDKKFKSKIYKELSKFNKKNNNSIKKVGQMISTNISPKIYLLPKIRKERKKNHMKICSTLLICAVLSHLVVSDSLWLPWTVACQAPLSMGILWARIRERVAMPSSKEYFQPRDRTQVSHITGRYFTIWDTRETQENWSQ